jgi:predicted RNA methylase
MVMRLIPKSAIARPCATVYGRITCSFIQTARFAERVMSSTGRGAIRRKNDYYETPIWCADVAVEIVGAEHKQRKPFVFDAGCGEGAILSKFEAAGYEGAGIEIDPVLQEQARSRCDGEIIGSDFLLWTPADFPSAQWPMAVMNPPFSCAQQFIEHALESCGSVLALLRLSFLESQKRRAFWRQNPADVYVLSRRPSFMGGKTDSCAYAWFLWGPGQRGRLAVI